MQTSKIFNYYLIITFVLTLSVFGQNKNSVHFTDTLAAPNMSTIPVIDGLIDDECWQNIPWQPIDQVWMTYGEVLPEEDFTGFYKIAWSSKTNLIYFLVKTTDDVLVDGYVYDTVPKTISAYPDFDILEVFIDEDVSGGLHVFHGKDTTAEKWGTNGFNAFSHHIVTNFPKSGETEKEVVVCDLEGLDWFNYYIIDFRNHFKDFIIRRNNNEIVWEFSLAVYSDKYNHKSPEDSRVQLTPNKVLGISLAYCDNDGLDEDPKTRDNFYGSVYVEKEAYNDHWNNADGYRRVILK